jgi:hypothetical protein
VSPSSIAPNTFDPGWSSHPGQTSTSIPLFGSLPRRRAQAATTNGVYTVYYRHRPIRTIHLPTMSPVLTRRGGGNPKGGMR